MNLFQWLTIPPLLLVCLLELIKFQRDRRRIRLMREIVWIAAVILIFQPQLASQLAQLVGIGRGTDLVFYLFMLVTPAVLFQIYAQQFSMRRDIVELARREALRTPIAGSGLSEDRTSRTESVPREGQR
jgi:hypothetical protein